MRALILVLLLALPGGPALAEMLPLPVDLAVEFETVELDLRDDSLEVIIDDAAEPGLRVFDAVSGELSEGYVSLAIDESKGILSVMRPHGDAMTAPPLSIELVITSGHRLKLKGSGFDARVSNPFLDEDEPRAPAGKPRVEVRADDARVSFQGVSGIDLKGEGSTFVLAMTASPLTAQLESGTIEVEDHVGDANFRCTDTEIAWSLSQGNVRAALTGGLLELREGFGSVSATLNEGTLRAEAWEGSVSVSGEAGLIEVMGAGAEESLLDVRGSDHSLSVEEFLGGVVAQLQGGEVRLKSVAQRVRLTAAGTRAELEKIGGGLNLRLSEGGSVAAAGITGKLDAQVEDAELIADGRDLELKLTRSNAELASEKGRVRVKAVDSDVSLKMESQQGYLPYFEVLGSSRVEVSMREPCAIVLQGEESMADLIDAGGCDLRVSGRRSTTRRAPGPTTLVTAKVAPGAWLEISSR